MAGGSGRTRDARIALGADAIASTLPLSAGSESIRAPLVETSPACGRFRPDIDGLRAVAIVLVVAYHARVPGLSGGFVGVDVFFVISGYLITRNLLAEGRETGTVHLGRFWARRIRRLIPALSLMLVATMVASLLILPGIEMRQIGREAVAAALYVSNVLYARAPHGYFATGSGQSPLLHTWSLGVEEQFYVFWPLFFAACFLIGRRRPSARRQVLVGGLTVMVVASFATNLSLTHQHSNWAFYGLQSRVWEFAAAGLLAAMPHPRFLSGVTTRSAAALAGLALVAAAAFGVASTTTYPGMTAILPVLGTMLLIMAGGTAVGASEVAPPTRALSARPAQWLGRVSYSWYLWHLPFIILAATALDSDSTTTRCAAALLSLPVAYAAHRFVENPVRFNPALVRSTARTLVLGGTSAVLVLATVGAVEFRVDHLPATSFTALLRTAQSQFFWRCKPDQVDGIKLCEGGDVTSKRVIMITGDSHAFEWSAALGDVAKAEGLRLVIWPPPGCPSIPIRITSQPNEGLTTSSCLEARRQETLLIAKLRPETIVLAESNNYIGSIEDAAGAVPTVPTQVDLWSRAYNSFLSRWQAKGIRVAVILDNVSLPVLPATCVARKGSIAACEPTRAEAFAKIRLLRDAELGVLRRRKNVASFDPNLVLCDAKRCRLELNGDLVYLDTNHLSNAVTRSMEPSLRKLLAAAGGP